MTNALKARLLGAAVLVGVALLVLGALLGGPKERAAPAGNVIIVQPGLEKPPALAQRQTPTPRDEPAEVSDSQRTAQAQRAESRVADTPAAVETSRPKPPTKPTTKPRPSSDPAPQRTEPAKAAESPAATSSSKTEPTAPAKNDLYAQIAGTAPARETKADEPATTKPAPSKPAPSTAKPAAPADPAAGWRVRVASYGDRSNAERTAARLRDGDFQTQLEPVQVGGKTYTRLYVGPYATERGARAAQSSLKTKIGESGQLIAPK
ncbi:SPOR domain-containing protein [Abyssibacter sp.]|uniref:SPOR domain-containing protein n=1 Tax=Abyssibacter sp. TaxID=2320200 RepID=UPI0025BBA11A|nr:SPOR domain-containing protein [Abyssibacter sp.]MCK5858378.1 SPOR domain-containing protein [Abyssibacter sp.]